MPQAEPLHYLGVYWRRNQSGFAATYRCQTVALACSYLRSLTTESSPVRILSSLQARPVGNSVSQLLQNDLYDELVNILVLVGLDAEVADSASLNFTSADVCF